MAEPATGARPVRTLVLVCPDWPVVAAGVPPTEPAVVVAANRVRACSVAARAHGVRVGQRRREAQAACPELAVVVVDEHRDARAFEVVLASLDAVTPHLEVTRPGWCAFPTRGPSRYFGGDEALAERVRITVDAVLDSLPGGPGGLSGPGGPGGPGGVGCRVGVADGPFAAGVAARRARPVRVVPPGGSAGFLAPLPIRVLGRPELTGVLERLGVGTLGALAALPSADVAGRFGAEGTWAHRLASGDDPRPPAVTDPPPDLSVVTELDPPAERADRAAFGARALAAELDERLGRRGLACTRLRVELETEHGETRIRSWRHEGALHPPAVVDRVRWQLEGWLTGPPAHRPTAGVMRLALVPEEVMAASGRQLGFWGGETASAERAARALARVQGLLGPDAALLPRWRGGRSPSEEVDLVPAHAVDLTDPDGPAADERSSARAPWPGRVPTPSPARLVVEPVAAEVRATTGDLVGVDARGLLSDDPAVVVLAGRPRSVVAWAGPWPADERWWDPPRRRRRARLQVLTDEGTAHLLALEGGAWWAEATYD